MAVKVLIVDDAMFMRNMIAEIFNGKKYKEEDYQVVAEAENGVEAVQKYREHNPDIVTMDIVMPEMTGIEALKEIMGIDSGANVIMCSWKLWMPGPGISSSSRSSRKRSSTL
jgi:two-component system chemotaxis response regulator CheY